MLNSTQYNLLMSEIYMSLNDTNSISDDLLTQYKEMVAAAEGFKNHPEENKYYLLRLVNTYIERASKTMPKETLLQHCTNILNAINANYSTINVDFYLKRLEYTLCDQFAPMADRVAILKECIATSTDESLDNKIECRSNLLDIYLVNPNEYLEDIRLLSSELKSLLALREAN